MTTSETTTRDNGDCAIPTFFGEEHLRPATLIIIKVQRNGDRSGSAGHDRPEHKLK